LREAEDAGVHAKVKIGRCSVPSTNPLIERMMALITKGIGSKL
jgi:hypothetical protein